MDRSRSTAPARGEAPASPGGAGPARRIGELRREARRLQEALVSHAVVDQATGVIITLGALRPDEGLEVLRSVSRRTGRALADVARLIVEWPSRDRLPDDVGPALRAALEEAGGD
ncbi:ANTAR domain-containing protein [Streptomyces sp. SID2955]|nr:ANTAR domain-containing protein [Streptomyces sp. SID2955]